MGGGGAGGGGGLLLMSSHIPEYEWQVDRFKIPIVARIFLCLTNAHFYQIIRAKCYDPLPPTLYFLALDNKASV